MSQGSHCIFIFSVMHLHNLRPFFLWHDYIWIYPYSRLRFPTNLWYIKDHSFAFSWNLFIIYISLSWDCIYFLVILAILFFPLFSQIFPRAFMSSASFGFVPFLTIYLSSLNDMLQTHLTLSMVKFLFWFPCREICKSKYRTVIVCILFYFIYDF